MTHDELRALLFQAVKRVAPESEPERVDPARDYREELDLDSVDFLNVAIGLHDALGIDIPETDYPTLATVDGCVAYLAARLAASGR
jgi:acyl carrier protein